MACDRHSRWDDEGAAVGAELPDCRGGGRRAAAARPSRGDERRRAVVRDKEEKKLATMVQQLNTIHNEKTAKREEQQARRRAAHAKAQRVEDEWRDKLKRETLKRAYREKGKAEAAAARAREPLEALTVVQLRAGSRSLRAGTASTFDAFHVRDASGFCCAPR